ncbi:hypothetical protein GXW82_43800 [Streptacidiphilus sp. 4-A2]|nr:hypothetical protein [Streptacidiphilus sp. 4-A2]
MRGLVTHGSDLVDVPKDFGRLLAGFADPQPDSAGWSSLPSPRCARASATSTTGSPAVPLPAMCCANCGPRPRSPRSRTCWPTSWPT